MEWRKNINVDAGHKNADKIIGSVLGLALGDAFGAPYEGGILERSVWFIIGREKGRRRWTDDTQMTIDVIESLIANGKIDQNDLAKRFSRSYRWSRGYGAGAAKILKRMRRGQSWEVAGRSVFPNGSWGNGGAMRSPAVGLFFAQKNDVEIIQAAHACAQITHAHPLGKEGAGLIALATALAYYGTTSREIIDRLLHNIRSSEFRYKLQTAGTWLETGSITLSRKVAAELGNGVSALDSCVTAVYAALFFRDKSFEDLLRFVIEIKGDVDSIAAMAGAIWGAFNGYSALPQDRLKELEQAEHLRNLAQSLAVVISK